MFKKNMSKSLILFLIVGVSVLEARKPKYTCKQKILKRYPDAVCVDVENLRDCKAECEHLGEKKCKGTRGEIRKLNCKKDKEPTCCCE